MRPNILWIVFDTARADALEPYGATPGATPAIADLARRGVALAGVHSTACWTLPAHVSMFAGGLPRQFGLGDQAGINPSLAKPIVESLRERSIVELLRRSGYRTGAVSANAWVTPHSGFGPGFDRFVDVRSGRQAQMSTDNRRAHARWLVEAARARVDDGARAAEHELGRWIADAASEPFFWFVNLVECHSPYLPPRPYAELSLLARVSAAREASAHLTMEAFWRTCITGDVPEVDALDRMRAGYRGAIRYMDDWLARLLEALDRAGLLDETLVMVCSDHGENFGEGDLIGHGFSLDQRLINVPFIAAGPGADSLTGLRSVAEVPRRLAQMTDLPDHPWDPADLPPLPVAQFDSPVPPLSDPRTQWAVAEWRLDERAVARMTEPILAVVDDSVKLVRRGDLEAFHHLRTDPLELQPLTADDVDPAAVSRLRAAAAHPSVVASESRLAEPSPSPLGVDHDAADLEDRMRLLGYL
jgi:arylsulfatase A-like enzyme